MVVPGGAVEHAGFKVVVGGARTRLFERKAYGQPGAVRSREFRVRPGRRLKLGQPRRGRASCGCTALPRG